MILNINEKFNLPSGYFALLGNSSDLTWDNRGYFYELTGQNISYDNENFKILEVEISRGGMFETPMKNRIIAFKVEKI